MRTFDYFSPDARELNPCACGRRRLFKGSSSSSSASTQTITETTNNVADKRLVVDGGGLGITGDGNGIGLTSNTSTNTTTNITTLDGGIVRAALDAITASNKSNAQTTQAAIDAVTTADATNGDGFTKLLGLADKLFTTGADLIETTGQTTLAQVAALNTAQNDERGAIDQKTITVLAVAGAVAAAAIFGGK